MPGKNIVKPYVAESFYHIYSRGVDKAVIFRDGSDYVFFMGLCKRYLSDEPAKDKKGRLYDWFTPNIQLLAFCLMPNHIHLMIFQHSAEAMTKLMRAVMSSYGMYFNHKYGRVGPLFQSNFRAVHIDNEAYLEHISRYVHLNPQEFETWPYSSLPYYTGQRTAEWTRPRMVLDMFTDSQEYLTFVKDYKTYSDTLKDLQHQLAST